MTLQQPRSKGISPILCHKCGAPIVFDKDHVSPNGKTVPLDPYFDNQPHAQHCMYFTAPTNPDLEPLLFDFLSKVPRRKRVIGAVGKIK